MKRFFISPEEKEEEQEIQEHEQFNYLMKRAKEYNEKQLDQKYDKYFKECLSRKNRGKNEFQRPQKILRKLWMALNKNRHLLEEG